MEFIDFIKDGVIETDLEVSSKQNLFKVLHEKLFTIGKVKESFYQGLIEREEVFPTGLLLNKYNVAIPHTDAKDVKESTIAIAILKNPITFQCMDDETKSIEVRIIFMLALAQAHSHMEVLQKLILMIQDELFLKNLLEAKNKDELLKLVSEKCQSK